MSSDLKAIIEGLYHEDERKRASDAARLYLEAATAAYAATGPWWNDQELAGLLFGKQREVTVGLAVDRETFVRIRAANGMPRLAEVPSDQDAEEFELHFPEGVALDILTSRAPGGDGAIAKYLDKFGAGIQQIEFRCANVDQATDALKEKFGIKAIYPESRPGSDKTRVNFFLIPASGNSGKVLIELYEKPAGGKSN